MVRPQSSGLYTLRRFGKIADSSEIDKIASVFENLRVLDIDADAARRPSPIRIADKLNSRGRNIAAYLLWLSENYPERLEIIEDDLRYVLPGFVRFDFREIGGPREGVVVDIREAQLADATPLSRVSFGTLRAIVLFNMLHDPFPPALTCLEEIDHGLHPHALDRVVDRLREASSRTQIIVATHSPALVNRADVGELIVFERNPTDGSSIVVDLSAARIRALMKETDYQLGELWFSGELGGVPKS